MGKLCRCQGEIPTFICINYVLGIRAIDKKLDSLRSFCSECALNTNARAARTARVCTHYLVLACIYICIKASVICKLAKWDCVTWNVACDILKLVIVYKRTTLGIKSQVSLCVRNTFSCEISSDFPDWIRVLI